MNPANDDYLRAAKEVFARMSPEGRVRFGRYLGQKAQRQGHEFIDLNQDGIDDRPQDPVFLAQKTTTQVQQEQQPGLLCQLFGGFFGGRHRHHLRNGHHDAFEAAGLFESGEEEDGGSFGGDVL